MLSYEIRILSENQTIIESTFLNDHAAVRAAQKFAAGKPFEVWRGLDCIYGAAPPRTAEMRPSPHQ